jgi:hypothetical protein
MEKFSVYGLVYRQSIENFQREITANGSVLEIKRIKFYSAFQEQNKRFHYLLET